MRLKKNQAVSIVVIQDDAVFLGRRLKKTDNCGKLGFPGGKVDPGETPLESAIRELRQETGIEVTELKPLGQLELVNPDFGYYTSYGFGLQLPRNQQLKNLEPDKNAGWVKIPLSKLRDISDSMLLPGTKAFGSSAKFVLQPKQTISYGEITS